MRRGGKLKGEVERRRRGHTGWGWRWRVKREISLLGQSSIQSLGTVNAALHRRPLGGNGGSVPHGALMKWLLTNCVHNALEAKYTETGRKGGSEGERER